MSKKSRLERLESFTKKQNKPKSKQVNNKTSKQKNIKTKIHKNKNTKKQVYKRKTYFISPKQHNELKLIAVKKGKNVSDLVRDAIGKYLESNKKK